MIRSEEIHLVILGRRCGLREQFGDGTSPMWIAAGNRTVLVMETSCTVMME